MSGQPIWYTIISWHKLSINRFCNMTHHFHGHLMQVFTFIISFVIYSPRSWHLRYYLERRLSWKDWELTCSRMVVRMVWEVSWVVPPLFQQRELFFSRHTELFSRAHRVIPMVISESFYFEITPTVVSLKAAFFFLIKFTCITCSSCRVKFIRLSLQCAFI